jgi:hypothetical protein
MNKEVKRSTVYIAVEIITDGYSFERLWTCSPEHEHTTPAEAAPCLFSEKCSNLYGSVGCWRYAETDYRLAYSPTRSNLK